MIFDLDKFAKLEKGWDSYSADPPTNKCISSAKEILSKLSRQPDRVSPSVIGGIGMIWRLNKTDKIYLELYNNGDKCIAYFGKTYFDRTLIVESIEEINKFIRKYSEVI
jgi:hypothetical protein